MFITPYIPKNIQKKTSKIVMKSMLKKEIKALNVGLSLNIMTKMATDIRYKENIFDLKLFILELFIGYYTYGIDRYEDDKANDNRKYLYDIILIIIVSLLSNNEELYNVLPMSLLIYSIKYYKKLKPYLNEYKSIYISIMWCISIIILPSILYENNFNILQEPLDYIPYMFLLISTSNKKDISDIEEDIKDNIKTIPVIYGKDVSKKLSNITFLIFISLLLMNLFIKFNEYFL